MSESGTLLLRIRDAGSVPAGTPRTFRLDRHGAVIGRSTSVDWTLPDPDMYISSRHCEVDYVGGGIYRLVDVSTNGTFVNGSDSRMPSAKAMVEGDVIRVGRYDIEVLPGNYVETELALAPEAEPAPPPEPAPPVMERDWTAAPTAGWDDEAKPAAPIETAPPAVVDREEPAPAPMVESAPEPEPTPEPIAAEPPSAAEAFGEAATSVPDSGGWGELDDSNTVDWNRGFGDDAAGATTAGEAGQLALLLDAAGLSRDALRATDDEVLLTAGLLLRQLVGGLVVMMEARARAKAQMGAQNTIFSRDGNNPIKFAMSPAHALTQLLSPPVSGFMSAERAVEDSYRDLQAHQIATLKAMQGALRATLDRFSPEAIKKRADNRGLFARIMPGSRAAALWEAYEREFGGVAQGSDEAFMDVFAQEFRRAYEAEAAKG